MQTGHLPDPGLQGSWVGPIFFIFIFLRFLHHASPFTLQLEPHPYFPPKVPGTTAEIKDSLWVLPFPCSESCVVARAHISFTCSHGCKKAQTWPVHWERAGPSDNPRGAR